MPVELSRIAAISSPHRPSKYPTSLATPSPPTTLPRYISRCSGDGVLATELSTSAGSCSCCGFFLPLTDVLYACRHQSCIASCGAVYCVRAKRPNDGALESASSFLNLAVLTANAVSAEIDSTGREVPARLSVVFRLTFEQHATEHWLAPTTVVPHRKGSRTRSIAWQAR